MRSRWRSVRSWLAVPSAALLLACVWVLGTAWSPVAAGHPAYLVTLLLAGVVGLLGLVGALVPLLPPVDDES